jgi:hypothetical protein
VSNWGLWAGGNAAESDARDTANSRGITVACGNATEGNWVEMIAATAHEATGLMITAWLGSNTRTAMLDVAVGAGGSEVVIAENLPVSRPFDAATNGLMTVMLPLAIPAGTRIAVRGYGSGAVNAYVTVTVLQGSYLGHAPYRRATTYGAAQPYLTLVDAGSTANTKSAWTEIVASTTAPIKLLYLLYGPESSTAHGGGGESTSLVDIGVGAAASEVVVLANLAVSRQRPYVPHVLGPIPVDIPAGSRIAVRAQCSSTVDDHYQLGIGILGLD